MIDAGTARKASDADAAKVVAAQGLEFIKANYTKYEFQIPMRDGKRLFTSVYVPKDTRERYPLMLAGPE